MKRDEISNQQVMDALDASDGIALIAAAKLKIHRNTLANWINDDPELKAHYDAGKESLIDLAESKLVENIKKGMEKSVIFALQTLGKNRGYVERQEYAEFIEQPLYGDAAHEPDGGFAEEEEMQEED